MAEDTARRKTAKKQARPHQIAPQKLKLLVTVVSRNKAEFYLDLIQSFGVNMQISVSAHGTAGLDLLHTLGIEQSEKRVIFSVIREEKAPRALAVLEEKFNTIKNGKGVAMTVPMTGVIGVAIYSFLCDNRRAVKEWEEK